jgi:P2-related tail formation protein
MGFGYAFMGVGPAIVKWPLHIRDAAFLPLLKECHSVNGWSRCWSDEMLAAIDQSYVAGNEIAARRR